MLTINDLRIPPWFSTPKQQLAQKKQVSRIILEVRKTNTPAIKAYEKQGFKIVGVRKNFYEKPIEDAYIMDVNI